MTHEGVTRRRQEGAHPRGLRAFRRCAPCALLARFGASFDGPPVAGQHRPVSVPTDDCDDDDVTPATEASGSAAVERPDASSAGADEDRAAILARRARFVASAMAGLVLGASCETQPQVCLNIAPLPPDAGPPPPDGGAADPMGADAGMVPDAQASALPEPIPGPCLRVAAPPGSASNPGPEPSPSGSGSAAPLRPPPPAVGPVPAPCLKVAPPRGAR